MAKPPIMLLPVEELEFGLFLRLYAFCITQITDWTFMRGVVCRRLRRELRYNSNAKVIVRHPIKLGVAHWVSALAIDRYFHLLTEEDWKSTAISVLETEILMEIMEAWTFVRSPKRLDLQWRLGERIGCFLGDLDVEKNWERRAKLRTEDGMQHRAVLAKACLRSPLYPSIRHAYSLAIADRILHDRQISGYIAAELTTLAPLKSNREAKQYVRRVKWPAFVRPLLLARDRGKCALCKVDIASELLAAAHIDHIYSLAEGGCNDVVNLQLTCEACNLKKGRDIIDVQTSVPAYHIRNRKAQLLRLRRQSPFATTMDPEKA